MLICFVCQYLMAINGILDVTTYMDYDNRTRGSNSDYTVAILKGQSFQLF